MKDICGQMRRGSTRQSQLGRAIPIRPAAGDGPLHFPRRSRGKSGRATQARVQQVSSERESEGCRVGWQSPGTVLPDAGGNRAFPSPWQEPSLPSSAGQGLLGAKIRFGSDSGPDPACQDDPEVADSREKTEGDEALNLRSLSRSQCPGGNGNITRDATTLLAGVGNGTKERTLIAGCMA